MELENNAGNGGCQFLCMPPRELKKLDWLIQINKGIDALFNIEMHVLNKDSWRQTVIITSKVWIVIYVVLQKALASEKKEWIKEQEI